MVPTFARARWGEVIDSVLDQVDAVLAGKTEKSIDQRAALIAFFIRVASAAIVFFSQVALARWMGGYQYGVFVWVWVAIVILGSLACLGFPSAVVRFIPEYRQADDLRSLRGIILGSHLFAFISSTTLALFGIAGIYLFEDQVSSIYILPLYLGAICLPMLAVAETLDGVSRAFSWISIALSPTYIIRPILILLFTYFAIRSGYLASATTAMTAAIVATWITTLIQIFMLRTRLKKTLPWGPKSYHPGIWLRIALPIFLVEGFFALLTNVDILIAGIFLDPGKVAIYFATVKTLALVHFVYFAVKASFAHRISQYYHAGDREQYHAVIHDTARWTFWPSLAISGLLLLIGPYLLYLFGEEFTQGYPLLFILVIGIVARASVGPAETVLTMSGQQNACAMIYGATLFINIVLNLLLIPAFGLMGAAIATTLALIYEAIALFVIVRRRLDLNIFALARHHPKTGE